MSSSPDADQARRELYDIMRQDATFEEKAQQALELGEAYLGVENGHVTRIDPESEYWEAIASSDDADGKYPEGLVLDLTTTYCRRTIVSDSSIALHNAPEQGWANDPAFEEQGLHCYHGTTLTVDGDPYGTVCFVSENPRETPFTADDTMFAELIARMLEHELEYNHQQSELIRRENTITVLSRVLRHNLRNDMSIIRGHVSRLADQIDEPDQAFDTIIRRIDRLLDLSDTARTLEATLGTKFEHEKIDLDAIIRQTVKSIETRFPSAAFTIEGTEDATVSAMPSLGTALEELLENAAKHAENPQIRISTAVENGNVRIDVFDNGPGLPEQEQRVLDEATEIPLIHGSGLGLWLVHEIVTAHDGSIDTDVSEDGTRMTITLPHSMAAGGSDRLQQRLQREHDRFEAVFDNAFDGICILDNDGRILEANSAAGTLFGEHPPELLGQPIEEFIAPEFDFESGWDSFISDGQIRGTAPIVASDGIERTVDYAATAEVIPGHHITIMRDVTEREERETELRRTSNRLNAVIEGCPEPLIVVDSDGNVERWNPAAEETFGWSEAEVVGKQVPIIPDDEVEQQCFQDAIRRTRGGERVRGLEVKRETKNGEILDARVSTAPIWDSDGTVDGTVAMLEDITERKEREWYLEQAETLFQNAQDSLFLVDVVGDDFTIERVNPAYESASGLSAESIHGKTPGEILGSDQGASVEQRYRECVDTRRPIEYEEELSLEGEEQYWETRIAPVMIDGEVENIVGSTRDITERKEREQRYNAVFNNAYQFMGLLDPTGRLLEANETALEFGGLDEEDVIGEKMWDTEWFQHSAETRQQAIEAVDRASSGEFVRMKLPVRGDGRDAVIDFSIRPVFDEKGNITLLVPEGRDITTLEDVPNPTMA